MPTPSSALTRVAVYRRRVAASEARVWENVRDWEHLPWLHRMSFRSIALEEEGAWGWRARVGLPPEPDGPEILLELRLAPDESRYVARTLAGPGAGSEIWTRVHAIDAAATEVEVAFWLPGVAPERAGAAAAPGPLTLGALEALRSRLPLCVELAGERWRLLDLDGDIVAHAASCPHWAGPLEDARLAADGTITCPWHGWRFDLRTGRSADGRGARLPAAPRIEVDADGDVRLIATGTPPRIRRRSASRC